MLNGFNMHKISYYAGIRVNQEMRGRDGRSRFAPARAAVRAFPARAAAPAASAERP
jgi:hypothetical protein